jgi:hypothetical protein
VVRDLKDRLGPGGLGGTTDYVCDKNKLTYKGSTHQDRHANFPSLS